MRPKKSVLLFCPFELVASEHAFKMRTWGYDVTTVIAAGEVIPTLKRKPHDLVLVMPSSDSRTWNDFDHAAQVASDIQWKRQSEIRLYDWAGVLKGNPEIALGVTPLPVPAKDFGALRDAIRIAMCRKRGPKKPLESIETAA
jgi:hypothetical protein